MRNPFADFSHAELLAIAAQIAAQIAVVAPDAIVSGECAAVVEGRARLPLAVPQWTTIGPDGQVQRRGVVIQALDYRSCRIAEALATDRRPKSATLGQVDDWRRLAEEVRLGVVEPANLPLTVVEGWGYDVVRYIHQQIERLGPIPPALLAAELAALAGGPPPADTPGAGDPDGAAGEPAADELGDEPVPGAGLG